MWIEKWKNGTISEPVYNKLFPSGSRPGILYGLPKVHKVGVPLRPILSSIGTHAYALAKFLVQLLRPFSSGNYMVSDSFSFANDFLFSNFNSDNSIMASFDIECLFTNIAFLPPQIFMVLKVMILLNFYNHLLKIVIYYLTAFFTNK